MPHALQSDSVRPFAGQLDGAADGWIFFLSVCASRVFWFIPTQKNYHIFINYLLSVLISDIFPFDSLVMP